MEQIMNYIKPELVVVAVVLYFVGTVSYTHLDVYKRQFRYDWYPKCRLTENSDDIATSEEKASDQTDTIKIKAYPFNNDGDIVARVGSGSAPEGLTEEKFFSKPILTKEDLAAVAGAE